MNVKRDVREHGVTFERERDVAVVSCEEDDSNREGDAVAVVDCRCHRRVEAVDCRSHRRVKAGSELKLSSS